MVEPRIGKALRQTLTDFYDGTCQIYRYAAVAGVVDQSTEVLVGENIPCHLDFEYLSAGKETECMTAVPFQGRLFLPPTYQIAAGCRVVVTQQERTWSFRASGIAGVYASHQEILLEGAQAWA